MRAVDENAVTICRDWWQDWHLRIEGRSTPPHEHRAVQAIDVWTAWTREFRPAYDPIYVMPDWWLALTDEEKRTAPRPQLIMVPRQARPADEMSPGFSMDDVGPFLKVPDGSIYRARKGAAHRLWRQAQRSPALRELLDHLQQRTGRDGRPIRGRTPGPVLNALVCFSLVHGGMTQVAAARTVLMWAKLPEGDPKKLADENRIIWRELRLPPVS
jgi:hypothetical protein